MTEPELLEAMHTGDYTAPDLEYTPIPDPLPRLVRREVEELRQKEGQEAAAEAEIDKLRADLAAERQRREAAEKDANELHSDNEMNAHYATRALHAEAALAAINTEHGRLYVKWENAMITLRAERQRREAAEAALAAVPVGALLRFIAHAQARGYSGAFSDVAVITAWVDAQPEVQP